MGCQNSNLVEVIPVDPQELHQPQQERPVAPPPSHPNQKENLFPTELSIKLHKEPPSPSKQPSDITKRKSKSEHRLAQDLLNDTTNLPQPKEEKKRTLIILEKSKTHSAKQVSEKPPSKPELVDNVGPSTRSIPIQQEEEKAPSTLMAPIVVEKQHVPDVSFLQDEPAIESLSEEMKTSRSGRSFKFQVYVESSAEILSKTQKFNHKLQLFMEKEEVAKYLQMLEYGEKEEILGRIYDQLEKKEEWKELSKSSKSCEPMVIVVTENGERGEGLEH